MRFIKINTLFLEVKPVATMLALAGILATALPAWSSGRQLDSHEHGHSTLKIAQEGNGISFELEAPANDIVGFEHKPDNEAQKAAITKALSQFKRPGELFSLPAGAKCALTKSDAEFEAEKDHAGFHVHWTMTCHNIADAKLLEVNYFKVYSGAHEIDVEAIGSAGQMSAEVEDDSTRLDLSTAIGG